MAAAMEFEPFVEEETIGATRPGANRKVLAALAAGAAAGAVVASASSGLAGSAQEEGTVSRALGVWDVLIPYKGCKIEGQGPNNLCFENECKVAYTWRSAGQDDIGRELGTCEENCNVIDGSTGLCQKDACVDGYKWIADPAGRSRQSRVWEAGYWEAESYQVPLGTCEEPTEFSEIINAIDPVLAEHLSAIEVAARHHIASLMASGLFQDIVAATADAADPGRALMRNAVGARGRGEAVSVNKTNNDLSRIASAVSNALPSVGLAPIHLALRSALAAVRGGGSQACTIWDGKILANEFSDINTRIESGWIKQIVVDTANDRFGTPNPVGLDNCRRACLGVPRCQAISYREMKGKCAMYEIEPTEAQISNSSEDVRWHEQWRTETRGCFANSVNEEESSSSSSLSDWLDDIVSAVTSSSGDDEAECVPFTGRILDQRSWLNRDRGDKTVESKSHRLKDPEGWAECRQRCLKDAECGSVSYYRGKGVCELYSLRTLTAADVSASAEDEVYHEAYVSVSRRCLIENNDAVAAAAGRRMMREAVEVSVNKMNNESSLSSLMTPFLKSALSSALSSLTSGDEECTGWPVNGYIKEEVGGFMMVDFESPPSNLSKEEGLEYCRQRCLSVPGCQSISFRNGKHCAMYAVDPVRADISNSTAEYRYHDYSWTDKVSCFPNKAPPCEFVGRIRGEWFANLTDGEPPCEALQSRAECDRAGEQGKAACRLACKEEEKCKSFSYRAGDWHQSSSCLFFKKVYLKREDVRCSGQVLEQMPGQVVNHCPSKLEYTSESMSCEGTKELASRIVNGAHNVLRTAFAATKEENARRMQAKWWGLRAGKTEANSRKEIEGKEIEVPKQTKCRFAGRISGPFLKLVQRVTMEECRRHCRDEIPNCGSLSYTEGNNRVRGDERCFLYDKPNLMAAAIFTGGENDEFVSETKGCPVEDDTPTTTIWSMNPPTPEPSEQEYCDMSGGDWEPAVRTCNCGENSFVGTHMMCQCAAGYVREQREWKCVKEAVPEADCDGWPAEGAIWTTSGMLQQAPLESNRGSIDESKSLEECREMCLKTPGCKSISVNPGKTCTTYAFDATFADISNATTNHNRGRQPGEHDYHEYSLADRVKCFNQAKEVVKGTA